jgi:hypothetical protein
MRRWELNSTSLASLQFTLCGAGALTPTPRSGIPLELLFQEYVIYREPE